MFDIDEISNQKNFLRSLIIKNNVVATHQNYKVEGEEIP